MATGAESELLLVHKQYSDLRGPGLVFPSAQLAKVVCELEEVYVQNIDELLPATKVSARLMGLFKSKMKGSELCCGTGTCDLPGKNSRLYTHIRLYFTLKLNTASFSGKSLKRNRKVMNITHR